MPKGMASLMKRMTTRPQPPKQEKAAPVHESGYGRSVRAKAARRLADSLNTKK